MYLAGFQQERDKSRGIVHAAAWEVVKGPSDYAGDASKHDAMHDDDGIDEFGA